MDAGKGSLYIGNIDLTFQFQRGFMDPLDKILSVIVMNAIVIVSQDQDQSNEDRRFVFK